MKLKVLVILAIFVTAGAFVWSSGQADGAAGVVQLEFMALGGPSDQEMFQKLTDGFNAQSPEVNLTYLPFPEGSWDKVRAMFAGGTVPDVIRVNDDDVYDLARLEQIVQLDPYIDKYLDRDDYYKATWQVLSVGGKVYSANVAFGTNVYHYNVNMVKDAGLKMPGDWNNAASWDDFVAAAGKLTIDSNNDGRPERYGVGYPPNAITPYMFSNGTNPLPEGLSRADFVQPKIIEILTEFQNLSAKWHYAPYVEEDKRLLFNSEKLAMIWDNEGIVPNIQQGIEWDITPMPKAKVTPYSVGYVRSFAIPKTSKNPDKAFSVYAYFFGSDGQKTLVDYGYGVPPLRSVAETAYASKPVPAHRGVYAGALDFEAPMPKDPLGAVWKKHGVRALGQELINGTMTPTEYLQRIQDEMETRIKELERSK